MTKSFLFCWKVKVFKIFTREKVCYDFENRTRQRLADDFIFTSKAHLKPIRASKYFFRAIKEFNKNLSVLISNIT